MDWLWILAFAGLMAVVHRSGMGCCGGHSHGGEKGGGKPEQSGDKGRQAAA